MNRPVSSLFAIASAAAALLAVVPASAQASYFNNFESVNNPGIISTEISTTGGTSTQAYTPATQASHTNYLKESGTTAGTNTNPIFIGETSSGSSYGYTSGANYTLLATTTPSSTTAVNGEGTFTNGQITPTGTALLSSYNPTIATSTSTVQAYSGTQSVLVSTVQNNTATTSFVRLQTLNATTGFDALSRPTVDLGGTVSFMVYFDPGTVPSGGTTPSLAVELGCNETSTSTTLGAFGGSATQTSLIEYDSTVAGASGGTVGANSAGPTAFPSGGFTVTSGIWQKLTFNLATDPATAALGARSTSGFGYIDNIDFSQVGSAGQVYNIYIDDLTITGAPVAAPEPSSWAAMGIGAFALLSLGLRARRRSAGQTAC